jgi:hypothetical protein
MATVTLTNGNDHYTTTDNDDLVLAKGGNDQIIVKSAFYDRENDSIRIAVYGGPGNDKIIGKLGAADRQTFYGGPGNDYIEVWGSVTHNGSAIGASGNDTLVCMGGDEGCGLVGGAGDDVLINKGIDNGGHGPVRSAMFGGPGRDVMIGNSLDYFVFATGDTVAGARRDVIKNFTPGQSLDVIDLSAMDANVKEGAGRPGFRLRGGDESSRHRRGRLLRVGQERHRYRQRRRQNLRDRAPELQPAARRGGLPSLGRALRRADDGLSG